MDTRNICDNCKLAELSWLSVDGRDIRESQYPPMIICKEFKGEFLYPDFTCDKFEQKGN